MPAAISASPRYCGALGRYTGLTPGSSRRWLRYCTIAKPKPIRAVAVRIHDINVRSRLSRVRIQPKWLSAVTLTSKRSAPSVDVDGLGIGDLLLTPNTLRSRVEGRYVIHAVAAEWPRSATCQCE